MNTSSDLQNMIERNQIPSCYFPQNYRGDNPTGDGGEWQSALVGGDLYPHLAARQSAWPITVWAQQAAMPLIGILSGSHLNPMEVENVKSGPRPGRLQRGRQHSLRVSFGRG